MTGPAQRVEVVYKISERRRRKHQGFVLGYGPSGFEFVFFYTENRLRGYGGRRRIMIRQRVPAENIVSVTELLTSPEDVSELQRAREKIIREEIKGNTRLRMVYFDLETQIANVTSDVYFSRVMRVRNETTRAQIIESVHKSAKAINEFAAKFNGMCFVARDDYDPQFEVVKSVRHIAKMLNEFVARFDGMN